MQPQSPKLLEDIRDVRIHGYELADHALVWSTIESQIPTLLRDVEALLA